ncbi:MAG: ABC transporter substrate-binding protein [Acidobacteria bacterium]|nr:ABC transporter substrate-binding protein [Acidobacteriota bacterium]
MSKRLGRAVATLVTVLALGLAGASAQAQQKTKMIIATGVDPAFAVFYIAKAGGIFEKNGLDVQLNTGPSGSAMVAFLVKNQTQAVLGAEQAGMQNFNLDPNVVVAAETTALVKWWAVVGRNIANMEGLKGKKVGVALGSGSEVFWLAIIEKLKLNPRDYTVINVEPPEMVAALERGNIDAFVSWEPWLTRAVQSVSGASILQNNEGILLPRVYLYMNKEWAEKNKAAASAFVRSLIQANDLTYSDRKESARLVASVLKLDQAFSESLMEKLSYDIRLVQGSLDHLKMVEGQIKGAGKLAKPIDWNAFVYPDLLKELAPSKVDYRLPN